MFASLAFTHLKESVSLDTESLISTRFPCNYRDDEIRPMKLHFAAHLHLPTL
jgi:hypothetical protein